MENYYSYIEPAWGYKEHMGVEYMFREDVAIDLWIKTHPQYPYTRQQALDDFIVVNWAVQV